MTTTTTTTTTTTPGLVPGRPGRRLGDDLERRRLELRGRRIELVLLALRDRATLRTDAAGGVPPALRQSIEAFGTELLHVRRRLSRLDHDA